MPAFDALQVEAQTVLHDFEPISNVGSLSSYVEETIPPKTAALATTVTVSLQRPTKTSRISKSRMKLIVPTESIVATVPTGTKDREVTVDIIIMASERSTDVERLYAFELALALAMDAFQDTLVGNKSIY